MESILLRLGGLLPIDCGTGRKGGGGDSSPTPEINTRMVKKNFWVRNSPPFRKSLGT